jgi:hypothetical protein
MVRDWIAPFARARLSLTIPLNVASSLKINFERTCGLKPVLTDPHDSTTDPNPA